MKLKATDAVVCCIIRELTGADDFPNQLDFVARLHISQFYYSCLKGKKPMFVEKLTLRKYTYINIHNLGQLKKAFIARNHSSYLAREWPFDRCGGSE